MNGMIVLPSGFSRRLLLVCLVLAVAVISPTVGQAQDQDLNKTVVVIGTGTIYKNDSASAKETAAVRTFRISPDIPFRFRSMRRRPAPCGDLRPAATCVPPTGVRDTLDKT